MEIQMINSNYSLECNFDFDNLTITEIDDFEKIIKELQEKFAEVKRKRLEKEREKKNE